MLLKTASDREWTATDYPGIERSVLRLSAEQGRTSLVRMKSGCRFPAHSHLGHEDVLVLSGTVSLAGTVLHAGDYLCTDPGEEHDVVAIEDTMFYVSSNLPTRILSDA